MSKTPNAVIESKAINALEDLVDDTELLHHDFHQIDKAPAWDGDILLYNHVDGEYRNAYLDAKLPVQIKGHLDPKGEYINKQQIQWSVKIDDLNIYYKDGGVLYFHIFVKNKKRQIFYSPMNPVVIKHYLDMASKKGNKEQINVTFFKLNKEPRCLYNIIRSFYNNRIKLGSGVGQIVPKAIKHEDIGKQTEIQFNVMRNQSVHEILYGFKTGDICIYSPLGDSGIYCPHEWYDSNSKASFSFRRDEQVRIGETVFYESVQVIASSDNKDTIVFSDNLELVFSKHQLVLNLTPKTDIHTLANDVQFLLRLRDDQKLLIGDREYEMPSIPLNKDTESIFNNYLKTDIAFESIGVTCLKPCKEYTERNLTEISNLLKLLDGKRNDILEEKVTLYTWAFDGAYVSFFITINDDGSVKAEGLFEKNKYVILIEDDNGLLQAVPSFRVVEPYYLARQYNPCREKIKEQIDLETITLEMAGQFMICGLVLINAYDECNDKGFLDLAELQFSRIRPFADEDTLFINGCQIKKRRGKLDEEAKEKLVAIKDHSVYTRFGVSVLLEQEVEAEKAFENMTPDDQERYKKFPIYTLYNKLNNN